MSEGGGDFTFSGNLSSDSSRCRLSASPLSYIRRPGPEMPGVSVRTVEGTHTAFFTNTDALNAEIVEWLRATRWR